MSELVTQRVLPLCHYLPLLACLLAGVKDQSHSEQKEVKKQIKNSICFVCSITQKSQMMQQCEKYDGQMRKARVALLEVREKEKREREWEEGGGQSERRRKSFSRPRLIKSFRR